MKQTQVVEEYCNSWRWSFHEENLVHKYITGSSIHICAGHSKVGDYQLDLTEHAHIKGSALNIPLKTKSFDTVISDPPWNLGFVPRYWKELKRIAKKRIIIIALAQMHEGRDWHKAHEEVISRQNGFQIKVLTVYDRQSHDIDSF